MSQQVTANPVYNPDIRVPRDLAHEPVNSASLLESVQPLADNDAYFKARLDAGINKMELVYGLAAMRAYATALPNQMVYCQGTGIYVCENTTVSEPEYQQITITGTSKRWTNVAGLSAVSTIATTNFKALAAIGDNYRLLNTGRTRMVSCETANLQVNNLSVSTRSEPGLVIYTRINSEIPAGSKLEYECYINAKGITNDINFELFYGDVNTFPLQMTPCLFGATPGYLARSGGTDASYTPVFGTTYQGPYAAANVKSFALIIYGTYSEFPVYFHTRVTVQEPV